ncbi:MAG TPA: hypothetical protein DCE70_07020 [Acinetobacter sp.]|uniref:hypothetical protein n=1 Tax=Acinetobacter variabilis TaxID=70346 RepID=UPI000EEB4444|nr:hypothetical protein [Acinetobacter variabilis]HAB43285.1 hypothetical protein [Acinetobacter sp.]
MDIQKELLAYEQSLQDNRFFKVENIGMCTVFDPEQNKYHPSDLCDPKEYKFIDMLNVGWTAWQAAKAQAVPEGFVLVSAEQMSQWGHMANYAEQYGCPECFEARGYAHNLGCEINAYFNVSEAQEPAND